MKLAVFGTEDLETAIEKLGIAPEELLVAAETSIGKTADKFCKPKKIKLSKYGIDWKNLDFADADIQENQYGKYDRRAPMRRTNQMLDNATHVLLLGEDKGHPFIERSIKFMKNNGCKLELLKYPIPETKPVAAPVESAPEEDIPF